jgi:DNA-binding NtrC family response regulator
VLGEGSGERAPRGKVLVIEDEAVLRNIIGHTLRDAGLETTTAVSGEEGLERLAESLYDVVLLDLNLPGMHGLSVLSAAPATQTDAQFIVMTAFGSVTTAVEAMQLGAFDYLNKPFRAEELLIVVRRALDETELRREVARLRSRDSSGIRSRIIGKTAAMERVFDLIERVAPTRANVLIVGETGTGKELVARAIHDVSGRSRRAFIPVNCSALTETLLESELFGHQRGAFTGAVQSKRGVFEAARGGTLFLDEVGTLALSTQVKLLRVLQERTVTPVGSTEPIPVDFRLVAATNRDLGELVEDGKFREDLFYRLNVFPIHVPPLRDRREDIPVLANWFRLRLAEELGVEAPPILKGALARMMTHDWPGNVRELENSVGRSMILNQGARALAFEPTTGAMGSTKIGVGPNVRARREKWDLERLEREHILAVLEDEGWHQAKASELLGINRRTLHRKLKKYRDEGFLADDKLLDDA